VEFIDAHREAFGVEPICAVLQIAPSTYYAAKSRPPSARSLTDATLKQRIATLHADNYDVYGAVKVWRALRREGVEVARCTVARLMGELGLEGARRGGPRHPITTRPDDAQERPADLVERRFTASRPNELWVADFTYVRSFAGWAYVAFIIDVYSRYIVGWQAATTMRTELVLDALAMARWRRRADSIEGVVHHSDAGSQYLSVRYSERLEEAGAQPSVGSRGDSYDNALAESTIGLYKTELINRRGPWPSIDAIEIATLEYIDWFNHRRLHGEIGHLPPAEYEAAYTTSTRP